VAQQERIGWGQLLLGRFGSNWCVLQDEHLRTFFHKSNTLSGSSWILAITQTIWTHVALVWELRNKARHGSGSDTRYAARYQQALLETSALYDRRHDVLTRDSTIFHRVIEKTLYRLSSWLNTWRPVILRSIRDADRLDLHNIPTIRQIFSPDNAPSDSDDSVECFLSVGH
jgi:hypothetical protein